MSGGVGGGRPGGLTALAVLNFIFGGLGAIGFLIMAAVLTAIDKFLAELPGSPSVAVFYLSVLISGINVVLLITSGVGYLGQKKFLGKTLGNVYGLLSLIGTAVTLGLLRIPFSIFNIIGLIYPVLTLALLNTVFKDDFPNP
jgi:hypothetical protein